MSTEATVGAFEDEERANRMVRWLRRSGLHARIKHVGNAFEVVVPAGAEERKARSVLQAVEHARDRPEPVQPSAWERLRTRVLNLEVLGTVVAVVFGAVLLLAVGLWSREMIGTIGWVGLIAVVVGGLVYFQFSGMPHSAVKTPRRYSHRHSVTMEQEQQVKYRHAWARDQWHKSGRASRRRKHPKE